MTVSKPKALVVDLETKPSNDLKSQDIFMVAGFRPDTEETLEERVTKQQPLLTLVRQLDHMSLGASFILGHNILAHDLPILKTYDDSLALLQLPAIDTLKLSPLAFPQNPYHRLVKDYKLIRDSLNSPLADCYSTLELFNDQRNAFKRLNNDRKYELLCYQSLLAPTISAGLGAFFASLTGHKPCLLTR
ncbi:hypothetical protein LH51_04255 [Nitrincola sp. A-D6]|uniref:hypothetical protein n=1 Tax=Nitrincola sp. A-D6 TaxID=1545442 RepID=UPI00051FEC04|nr:hypothetical protein [Nitrincola sp. A-D6]KGK42827.1 hypothetical protein LH51_04255 [Nitrincola sp. A-D6]